MNDHQWQEVIGTIGMFVLVLTVVTLTLRYVFNSRRAKVAAAKDDVYRELAEAALEGQQRTERQLGDLTERLTDLQARTGSLERILKEVE
jgi:hypothetical protein